MVEVRPMFQSGGGAPSRVIITAPTPGAPTTFLSASELQKKENKAIQLLFFKPKGTMQPMTVTVNQAQVAGGLGAPAPSIMPPSVIVEEPVAPLDLSCRKREPSGGGEEEPSPSPPLVPKVETVLLPMAPVAGPSLPTQPLPQQLGQLMPLPPGHLTVNNICSSLDEPQFIPRSNSDASTCSNASSTMSGFEDRKQKRKEQNKAAAQTYRQRKKSFSDKIDSEYDILSRKNGQLKTQKNLLEGQISRMRFLLNEQIKEEKKGSKEPLRPRASSLSWHPGRNAPPVAVTRLAPISQLTVSPIAETPEGPAASSTQVSPPLPPPAPPMPTSPSLAPATVIMAAPAPVSSPPQPNFSTSSLMPTADDFSTVGPMRSRKYTWPMTLTGKDRKKEQNKLASRRFRQRRKQEMSHCDVEAAVLENNNKRLREHCDALESKINLLKDFINKVNAKTGTDLVATARAKQQQQPAAAVNAAKALSTLSLHSPPRRSSVEEEEEEAME